MGYERCDVIFSLWAHAKPPKTEHSHSVSVQIVNKQMEYRQ